MEMTKYKAPKKKTNHSKSHSNANNSDNGDNGGSNGNGLTKGQLKYRAEQSARRKALIGKVFVSLISILAGILSPPILHWYRTHKHIQHQNQLEVLRREQQELSQKKRAKQKIQELEERMQAAKQQKEQKPPPLYRPKTQSNHDAAASAQSTSSKPSNRPGFNSCSPYELRDHLHQHSVAGMHVICISGKGTLVVYAMATSKLDPIEITLAKGDHHKTRWEAVQEYLQNALNIPDKPQQQPQKGEQQNPTKQPWAIFSTTGHRIVDGDFAPQNKTDEKVVFFQMRQAGIMLMMEGGQFLWPGIRKGFRREVDLSHLPMHPHQPLPKRNVTMVTLSLHPLVLSIEGFLSEAECDRIRTEAEPSMQYSKVSLTDDDKGRADSDFRTSQSAFLNRPFLGDINYRTASLVRVPHTHQEHLQVLRYGVGEKYDHHHDFFDTSRYRNDPQTLRMTDYGRRNRMATVFWYLSTVQEGGETIFPRVHKAAPPRSMSDCSKGLKVKPEKGKVVVFYNLRADGGLDHFSLHGACPVESGVKWAANKWIWNAPMPYTK